MSKQLNIAENVSTFYETPKISKSKKDLAKEKIKELINEECRMVRGIFQCFETPGSTTKICVKKYPGVQPFEKEMTDGETYDVPLYVARHLNGVDVSAGALADGNSRQQMIGTCSYVKHGFVLPDRNSDPKYGALDKGIPVPIVGIAKRIKRFGFQSLEFAGAIE